MRAQSTANDRELKMTIKNNLYPMLRDLALAAVLLGYGQSRTMAQVADGDVKRFDNSIVATPPPQGPAPAVTPLQGNAKNSSLQLHFGLATQNIEELKALVEKGETVSPSELATKYSGSAENSKKLTTWLSQHGFSSIETSPDNTSVYAKASAAQIEKSLGVTMKNVTYNGETKPAAVTAPTLPRDIGDAVVAIDGLQPWIRAIKHTVPRDQKATGAAARNIAPVPRPQLATKPATYKVNDILKAYNADRLQVAGGGEVTGKGQTIAILIDTFPLRSDLVLFWQKNGLAVKPTQIQLINVQGNGANLPPREGEETLDVQWASGIAPGATIRVYAAGSLTYPDLDRALDKIFLDAQQPGGLRHLSVSLGLREDLVSPDELKVEASTFLKLAALGVTAFVSYGDAGSNPDSSGHGRGADSVVEYEASDPWIVAVGGTSLQLDRQSGQLTGETAWADSGGGVSRTLSRPTWQSPQRG
jgi:kumamolisin